MMSDIRIEQRSKDTWYYEVQAGPGIECRRVHGVASSKDDAFAKASAVHDELVPPEKPLATLSTETSFAVGPQQRMDELADIAQDLVEQAPRLFNAWDEAGLAAINQHIRDEGIAGSPLLSALAQDAVEPPHELWAEGAQLNPYSVGAACVPERDTAHETDNVEDAKAFRDGALAAVNSAVDHAREVMNSAVTDPERKVPRHDKPVKRRGRPPKNRDE